jgi:hypothetical protein
MNGQCSGCGSAGQECCQTQGPDICYGDLGCGNNNMCQACGADDQPCCANRVCDTGFTCDVSNQCEVCGGLNQLCCANNTCTTQGLTCRRVGGTVGPFRCLMPPQI